MHEAGKLFHAWGVALGQKLEIVLKKKRQSLPSIQEEEGKKAELLDEEMEEDFLDEGLWMLPLCILALTILGRILIIIVIYYQEPSVNLVYRVLTGWRWLHVSCWSKSQRSCVRAMDCTRYDVIAKACKTESEEGRVLAEQWVKNDGNSLLMTRVWKQFHCYLFAKMSFNLNHHTWKQAND